MKAYPVSVQTESTPGSTFRAVRRAKGRKLRHTAVAAGIDPAHLSRVERGEKQLSVDAMHRLAKVLELNELADMLEPYITSKGRVP